MSIYLEPIVRAGITFTILQGIVIWLKGPKSGNPIVQMLEFWVGIFAHIVFVILTH